MIVLFLTVITSLAVTFQWHISVQIIFGVFTLTASGFFFRFQKVNDETVKFLCPAVPVIPLIGIYCNVYMVVNLSWVTWVRLFVWLLIGFVIYFGYSIKHSKL